MKKLVLVFASAIYLVGFGISEIVFAQKWADLTMTVYLHGDVPKRKPLQANPQAGGRVVPIITEDLEVDPETKAIKNTVFMVDSKRTVLGANQLHPDSRDVPQDKPKMEVIDYKFVPHILAVRAGQTLVSKSRGPGGHNPKFSFFKNNEVGQIIPAGADREIAIQVPEPGPTKVECSIHPWMVGYVIVTDHPYVGISDASGKIKIDKLPAGIELHFKLWHESQNRYIEEVAIDGKQESWKKGIVKLVLKEGVNDLGDLLIKPERFRNH